MKRTSIALAVAALAAAAPFHWVHAQTVVPVPAIPSSGSVQEGNSGDTGDIPLIEPDTATPPTGAIADAEKKKEANLRGTLHDPDYKKALEASFPLTPEQIEDYGRVEDSIDRATASRKPPAVSTATLHGTTKPGVAPQRVLLSDNYVTSLSVLDATGSPWPLARAKVGNPAMFTVEVPVNPGNVVIVTPLRKYASSNLMLILKDNPIPIMLTLDNNRDAAYYNANLVMDEMGPNARREAILPPTDPIDDAFMRAILDGAGGVTAGIRQVKISGGADTTAFIAGTKFYLRTPYTLVFPNNNTAGLRSGEMRVYELPISPLITVADRNGRPIDLQPSDETLIEGAISAHVSDRNPVSSMKVAP